MPLWTSIQTFTQDAQTIVVVPSITLDSTIRGARQQAYEERFLFLLLLLRQPRARLIYVTSQAIHPEVVDYYLDLLPGVLASHAKKRLFLVSPLDGSSRPLSQKLLERPRLIQQIRALIPDLDRAHLVPFNTTPLERDLALALGIPMYGADPKHTHLGGKSGARRIFAEEGVSHPLGIEDLHSAADLAAAMVEMRARKPSMRKVVVKLNEGVSGEGNAHLDLDGLGEAGSSIDAVTERLRALRFESGEMTLDAYFAALATRGGIVEERIVGQRFPQPERAVARDAAGEGRGAFHTRSGAGRAERPELSRLPLSGQSRVRARDHARGDEGGPPAEARRRARPLRAGFRHRAETIADSGTSTRSRSTCGRAGPRIHF